MHNNNIDVLCLSETFLNPDKSLPLLNEFTIYRTDRDKEHKKKGGGGVVILAKPFLKTSNFIIKSIQNSPPYNCEICAAKIKLNNFKTIIVVTVYRPPGTVKSVLTNDFKEIKSALKEVCSLNFPVIVNGDFNLPEKIHYDQLCRLFNKFHLTQLVNENTRDDSRLDLIFTNSNKLSNTTVFEPHLSDHKAVQADYLFQKRTIQTKTITFRNYNNINYEAIATDLSSRAAAFKLGDNIDSNFAEFTNTLRDIFDKHAPILRKTFREYPKRLIINPETAQLMKLRNKIYKQYSTSKYIGHREQIKELNKKVKLMITRDAKIGVAEKIDKRGLWQTINQYIKPKADIKIPFTAEEINTHFTQISTSCPNDTDSASNDTNSSDSELFNLHPVSTMAISKAWAKMKHKTSTSEDANGISHLMMDFAIKCPPMCDVICKLFNQSIQLKQTPALIKIAKIIPLPKTAEVKNLNDIRPISILPVIAKILEKLVYQQLISYLVRNNLISDAQYGFRPMHSTKHAELLILNMVHNQFKQNNLAGVVGLDIAKAFDTVDRNILLSKLQNNFKIDKNWFASYINDRQQYVSIHNLDSSIMSTTAGISQGGGVSGIIFSMMINDLPSHLSNNQMTLYADDSQIIQPMTKDTLDQDLMTIEQTCQQALIWMKTNKLKVNAEKTTLIIHSKHKDEFVDNAQIKVGNAHIKSKTFVKSLGLLKDNQLKWDTHINELIKKCNRSLWTIRSLYHYINIAQRKQLVESLILSKLYYMISVWGECKQTIIKLVYKVFRSCQKLVLGAYPTNEEYKELGWLPPSLQYEYEIAVLAFQIKNKLCPPTFRTFFNESLIQQRQTRSGECKIIDKNSCSDHLQYIIMSNWIKIPEEIRNNNNINIFKKGLKLHYLQSYYVDDDENCCTYSFIDTVISNAMNN